MELLNKKIRWLLNDDIDLDSASHRLRCFHFARYLEEKYNYDSTFYKDAIYLAKFLTKGDTVIIVKNLDIEINRVVLRAYYLNIPVIVDICDNLIDPYYKKNEFLVANYNLISLSKFITKITVPNFTLKTIIKDCLKNCLHKPDLFVLPDPYEKAQDLVSTSNYLISKRGRKRIKSFEESFEEKKEDKLLWFGNSSSTTSNMGFVSLIPHLRVIKRYQDRSDFVLSICSNLSTDISYLDEYKINYKLVEWSLKNIFYELSTACCSLITTGNDKRCITKSNNRIIKSLANGCPVIVMDGYNYDEFKGTITNSLKRGLNKFIHSKNRTRNIKLELECSKSILKRYSINNLGETLQNLIKNSHLINNLIEINKIKKDETQKEISIICDNISIYDLEEIHNKSNKDFIIKYYFYNANKELLDFYITNRITPYNLKLIDIKDKNSDKFFMIFNNDKFIILNKDTKIDNLKEIKNFLINKYKLKIISYKEFLSINKSDYKEKIFIQSKVNLYPENIPGHNFPIDISDEKKFDKELDILFVTSLASKNWILDALAKEIGSRSNLKWAIFYSTKGTETFIKIPKTKSIMFMHQSLLDWFVDIFRIDTNVVKVMCWYTHPNPKHEFKHIIKSYVSSLNRAHKVIFACNKYRNLWIKRGLEHSKAITIIGGADEKIFEYHARKFSKYIGLCSSFYERKNPILILNIIKQMPDYQFIILGKDWEKFSLLDDLLLNGNVEYIQASYKDYPKYYKKMNVFLSTSNLEGGPIPLIEAMMSNCIPVTSNVGFCPDIIKHGENGFLFDISNTNAKEISKLIIKAFNLTELNIRDTVLKYNWDSFSRNVLNQLN